LNAFQLHAARRGAGSAGDARHGFAAPACAPAGGAQPPAPSYYTAAASPRGARPGDTPLGQRPAPYAHAGGGAATPVPAATPAPHAPPIEFSPISAEAVAAMSARSDAQMTATWDEAMALLCDTRPDEEALVRAPARPRAAGRQGWGNAGGYARAPRDRPSGRRALLLCAALTLP